VEIAEVSMSFQRLSQVRSIVILVLMCLLSHVERIRKEFQMVEMLVYLWPNNQRLMTMISLEYWETLRLNRSLKE